MPTYHVLTKYTNVMTDKHTSCHQQHNQHSMATVLSLLKSILQMLLFDLPFFGAQNVRVNSNLFGLSD